MATKIKNAKKDKVSAKAERQFEDRKKSLQELIPIKEINSGCFVDEDGRFFPVIELGTINFDLMSEDERLKLTEQVKVAIASFRFKRFQVCVIPIPFDIDGWVSTYNEKLDSLKRQEDMLKAKYEHLKSINDPEAFVYADDLHFNAKMQNTLYNSIEFNKRRTIDGNMTSKKSYIIPFIEDNDNLHSVLEVAHNVVNNIRAIGTSAKICSDLDLRIILQVILNPKNGQLVKTQPVKSLPFVNSLKGGF